MATPTLEVVVTRGVPRNEIVGVMNNGPAVANDAVVLKSGVGIVIDTRVVGAATGATVSFPMQPVGLYSMEFKNLDSNTVYVTKAFEVKVEPYVCLEMEFLGKNNGWTIVRDWLRTPGISWHRGLPGTGIMDLMADVGTMNFTLDNSERNSAGKIGYYSPDHGNKRHGFYLNIGVRVRVGSTVRFTGVLGVIDPVPGLYGVRTVSCEATDWMGVADRTRLENLPVQVNKRGDQVLQVLLDSLPGSAKPDQVQMDISPDTYPYTLDRTRDEQTVLRDEMYRICASGLSLIYLLGNGTLVFEARGRRVGTTVNVDTFTDSHGFSASHDRTAVINRVQTTIHPRLPGTTDVVLYAMPQAIPLQATVPLNISGPWVDPANPDTRVGATSLAPLVRGTDYVGNTKADGTGVNTTDSLTIQVGLSGNATTFNVVSSVDGYLIKLQQRGKPLYDYGGAILKWEDETSIAQFGVASQQIDMPYTADPMLAQEVSQFVVYNNAFPMTNVSGFNRIVDLKNTIEVQRSISRLISDRIAIQDIVTGVSKPFFINAIDETISDGRLQTQWLLVPADTTGYWLLEVPGFSELDLTTRLAFGQIIGHTDIPHADTHGDQAHYDIAHSDTHTDNPHVDVLHEDYNTHTDNSDHQDVTLHNDVTHQDVAHADGAHTDVSGVNWHTDVPHNDEAHEDYHADVPHQDQPHDDTHDDRWESVPAVNFQDHVDCWVSRGWSHHDGNYYTGLYEHLDCWSSQQSPDPNPYGAIHTDQNGLSGNHIDTQVPWQLPTNVSDSVHHDFPHTDNHGDAHWDTHADQGHSDVTIWEAHEDYPAQWAHGDVAHQDVPHGDVIHTDIVHVDNYPHTDQSGHADSSIHTDSVHQDITHGDVAHTDVAHSDSPHADSHQDFHGDVN